MTQTTLFPAVPRHPAPYSKQLLPLFAELLAGRRRVLDPFAGIGRVHDIDGDAFTVGVELEAEWAAARRNTMVADACALPFADSTFDAVCTSPTYGNRMADHHEARDGSTRHSYRHDLGRPLHPANSGGMQWGDAYRALHVAAWAEVWRVLELRGLFVLNVKDHVRKGELVEVSAWHHDVIIELGFKLDGYDRRDAAGLRFGANRERTGYEHVFTFVKVSKR